MNIWDDLEDMDLDPEQPIGYAAMVYTASGMMGVTPDGDTAYVDFDTFVAWQQAWKEAHPAKKVEDGDEDFTPTQVIEVEHDNDIGKEMVEGHKMVSVESSKTLEVFQQLLDEDEEEDEEYDSAPPVFFDPDTAPWWIQDAEAEVIDNSKVRAGKAEIAISWQGNRPRCTQRFNNLVQLVDFLGLPPPQSGARYSRSASRTANSLGLTWDATVKMLVAGWPEGVERIMSLEAKIKQLLAGALPEVKQQYEVKGQVYDVGKLVAGEPEIYLQDEEWDDPSKKKKGRIIHLVTTFDIAYEQAFIMRGAAICAVANILQRYDNNKVIIDCHIGSNDIVDTWIRVKEAAWPVNYSDMAFITAHPAMFWRVAYGCWELLPTDVNAYAHHLGYKSMGYISEPPKGQRGDCYISALASSQFGSEKETIKWVVEELVKQGIEVDLDKVEGL